MNKPQKTFAVTQLRTWLAEVGIEIRARKGNDTVVIDSQGNEQTVTVTMAGAGAPEGALAVSAKTLTSRQIRDGFQAFMDLQRSLGFAAKMPVDRGRIPDQKLANNADFNLPAFRHTEFRRSPNPSAEKFKIYDKAITRACWKFFRTNETRCTDNMLSIEDLKTYAQVWMTNFVGLYEMQKDAADLHVQNEKLLTTYLAQRFDELRKLLMLKERNELAKLDDAFIGTRGRTYNYMNKDAWFGDEVLEEESAEENGEDGFIDTSTAQGRTEYKVRQAVFAELLNEKLVALGHDKMVEVLTEAAENDRIHPDASEQARAMLEQHREGCETCKAAPVEAPAVEETKPTNTFGEVERVLVSDEEGCLYASPGEAARIIGGIHRDHVKAILAGKMKSFRGHTFKWITTKVPAVSGGLFDKSTNLYPARHSNLK